MVTHLQTIEEQLRPAQAFILFFKKAVVGGIYLLMFAYLYTINFFQKVFSK